ncbi:hypothetical protein DFP72DRAFT_831578 [Ephemerocybe angulata]|uniref:Uncharacterized protein n=1 Tax=Ephemerocybe angulata TaxID=980116 RepID=A0A8H6LTG4_9AGAR|nr:hypothetical protein DFP72DRAFT_831578 [Tulosesus angulatus]
MLTTAKLPPPASKVAGQRRKQKVYRHLEDAATAATRAHGKAATTIANYEGHLRRMRAFLLTYKQDEASQEASRKSKAGEAESGPEHEIDASADDDPADASAPTTMDPDFPWALDGPPKACTPLAIALYMYHRCGAQEEKEEKIAGIATADQIHAAVAWLYDELDGDRYRSKWYYDSASQSYMGNPARSARVSSMLRVIKNMKGDANRNHSRPISREDMDSFHTFRTQRLEELKGKDDLPSKRERAELVQFGALSSTAWLIWLRQVLHLSLLRARDLDLSPPKQVNLKNEELRYSVLNVHERKNWTRKHDQELTGHVYHIYNRPDQPSINADALMRDWIALYESEILHRDLQPDDFLFPAITASLKASSHAIYDDAVRALIYEMAQKANVKHAGEYKTHGFRRGGAQYRFMYAPLNERWTLARIRWWGGWAAGEKGDTLVKYLIDELFTYDDDHRNALMPNDHGGTSDLKGRVELSNMSSLTQNDGHELLKAVEALSRKVDDLTSEAARSAPPDHIPLLHTASRSHHQALRYEPYPTPSPHSSLHHQESSTAGVQSSFRVALPQRLQGHVHNPPAPGRNGRLSVPSISRSPQLAHQAWKMVVDDWDGVDSKRCPVPLRDWRPEWYIGTSDAQSYHDRKMIALEFIETFRRDEALFRAAYPESQKGYSALLKAIRRKQQSEGRVKTRTRRG